MGYISWSFCSLYFNPSVTPGCVCWSLACTLCLLVGGLWRSKRVDINLQRAPEHVSVQGPPTTSATHTTPYPGAPSRPSVNVALYRRYAHQSCECSYFVTLVNMVMCVRRAGVLHVAWCVWSGVMRLSCALRSTRSAERPCGRPSERVGVRHAIERECVRACVDKRRAL